MTDFLSKYRQAPPYSPGQKSAQEVLEDLSKQLFKEWGKKGISSYVVTSQGLGSGDIGNIIISLKLTSGNDRKQYYYRLIEIKQSIDTSYPVSVRAFQNPPTKWVSISSAKKLEKELIDYMGDDRIKVIMHMIKQMGRTIRSWSNDSVTLKSKLGNIGNKDLLSDNL